MFAGAAFTDQADIKVENEVVDTLIELGVINGYTDGSFKPNDTVTRAEMAKMIYVLRTGNSDASAYNDDYSTFTDIKGHWARGYVKYCQSLGIIAGQSATKFAPDQTVTAQEAAKMLLVTLGYDATKAGLVGINGMNEILDAPLQTGSEQLTNQGCDIVFDHVGFAYNSGETVLRDVSFTAKQGEVTALVGPSGGGKTTVSRLAARFWDYQKGSITVGGMEVSRIDPEKLMSLYSIVFQDVTLFDNTILENIRLGRKGATDEEVLAAAKLANCEEFAEKLPDKWNTNIGENGCALSGGERQRISIARAFLKDAPIILLDEATASLDVENETAIQEALSRLIKHKTVLIIAHRMRTVAGADKIVVLSGGIVVEQGSPAELYAQKGLYTHMVDLQTESQRWAI